MVGCGTPIPAIDGRPSLLDGEMPIAGAGLRNQSSLRVGLTR